jgi:hypothetical protein
MEIPQHISLALLSPHLQNLKIFLLHNRRRHCQEMGGAARKNDPVTSPSRKRHNWKRRLRKEKLLGTAS